MTRQPPREQQQPQPTPAAPEIEERAEKAEEHATALARTPAALKDLVTSPRFREAVADVAPSVLDPKRYVRTVVMALTRTPKLAECTRPSFTLCAMTLASLGLEPDGRNAHLIPFKNRKVQPNVYECQLIIDYKGLAALVRRSGDVSFIHADAVFEGDEFDVSYGTGGHLIHKPGDNRTGKPKKFYSYVKLKDGSEDFDTMTLAEVERIRKRSKSPDEGPWVTDFIEMGKKTVFRRHSKWLPLSPEIKFAVDRSEPEAIETSTAWGDMIGEGAGIPQRLTAREAVMNPPPIPAQEGSEEMKPGQSMGEEATAGQDAVGEA